MQILMIKVSTLQYKKTKKNRHIPLATTYLYRKKDINSHSSTTTLITVQYQMQIVSSTLHSLYFPTSEYYLVPVYNSLAQTDATLHPYTLVLVSQSDFPYHPKIHSNVPTIQPSVE